MYWGHKRIAAWRGFYTGKLSNGWIVCNRGIEVSRWNFQHSWKIGRQLTACHPYTNVANTTEQWRNILPAHHHHKQCTEESFEYTRQIPHNTWTWTIYALHYTSINTFHYLHGFLHRLFTPLTSSPFIHILNLIIHYHSLVPLETRTSPARNHRNNHKNQHRLSAPSHNY